MLRLGDKHCRPCAAHSGEDLCEQGRFHRGRGFRIFGDYKKRSSWIFTIMGWLFTVCGHLSVFKHLLKVHFKIYDILNVQTAALQLNHENHTSHLNRTSHILIELVSLNGNSWEKHCNQNTNTHPTRHVLVKGGTDFIFSFSFQIFSTFYKDTRGDREKERDTRTWKRPATTFFCCFFLQRSFYLFPPPPNCGEKGIQKDPSKMVKMLTNRRTKAPARFNGSQCQWSTNGQSIS